MHSSLRVFGAVLLLLSLTASFSSALAAAPDQARPTLEKSITRVLKLVQQPGFSDPQRRAAIRADIEAEARKIFDFEEFSSRTVGIAWRNFSPQQKALFSDSFADLLLVTYLDKVKGYDGERIAYNGEAFSPEGDRVEIRTVITLKNGKATPVAYRMLAKNDAWWVYDVLVEGISLVKNYRTQFQEILSKGAPEQLIERVNEKARALKEKTNAS